MSAHTCIAVDSLPWGKISMVALIGWVGRKMWRDFEGGRISRCREILRKYGSPLMVSNPIHMPTSLYMPALGEIVEETYVWDHDMSVWWPLPTNKHHKVRWPPQFLWPPFDGQTSTKACICSYSIAVSILLLVVGLWTLTSTFDGIRKRIHKWHKATY